MLFPLRTPRMNIYSLVTASVLSNKNLATKRFFWLLANCALPQENKVRTGITGLHWLKSEVWKSNFEFKVRILNQREPIGSREPAWLAGIKTLHLPNDFKLKFSMVIIWSNIQIHNFHFQRRECWFRPVQASEWPLMNPSVPSIILQLV